MSVQLTGDVGKGVGGLGKFIFYGTLAYIVYKIYRGSSLSYLGKDSIELNSSNSSNGWKPLSEQELMTLKYRISK